MTPQRHTISTLQLSCENMKGQSSNLAVGKVKLKAYGLESSQGLGANECVIEIKVATVICKTEDRTL